MEAFGEDAVRWKEVHQPESSAKCFTVTTLLVTSCSTSNTAFSTKRIFWLMYSGRDPPSNDLTRVSKESIHPPGSQLHCISTPHCQLIDAILDMWLWSRRVLLQ